jgi:hypothetical protein
VEAARIKKLRQGLKVGGGGGGGGGSGGGSGGSSKKESKQNPMDIELTEVKL